MEQKTLDGLLSKIFMPAVREAYKKEIAQMVHDKFKLKIESENSERAGKDWMTADFIVSKVLDDEVLKQRHFSMLCFLLMML
jgi:hypothetical protein